MAYDGKLKFDTGIDLSGFQAGIDGISTLAEKGLSGVKSLAEMGMNAIKSSVSMTVDVMKQAGESVADLSKKAVDMGKSFESSMSQVIATMGVTKDSMVEITNTDGTTSMANAYDMLSAKAKEMGATTQFSASEAADALNYLALAGYDAQKACDALPAVLDLASAGGMDLAYASDLATDAMSALGMEATTENLTHFGDSLAKTASRSNTSVAQLGEAILVCGGQAKLAGLDLTEMNTMLGILADNGIKGSEGGTALRNVLKNIYTPTSTAAKAIEELGISTADANGNLRDIQDILIDTMSALEGLSESDRINAMGDIFDTRTIAAASATLNNSKERYNELSAEIENCDGAMAQMAETMNDNLEGDLKIWNSALGGLGGSFYENIVGSLRETVQDATGWITQLDNAFKTDGFTGLSSAFADVLSDLVAKAYLELPEILKIGENMVTSLCDGIKNDSDQIRFQGSEIISALAESFVSNFNSFYSTGFSIISAVLSGLNSNSSDLTDTARDFIIGISRTLATYLPSMVKNGSEIILSLIKGISAVIPSLLETGAETLTAIITGVSEVIPKLLPIAVKIINSLISAVTSNLPVIMNTGLEIIMSLINAVISNLPMLISTGLQMIVTLITGIASALPVLIEMIPEIINTIVQIFMDNFGLIMELGVTLLVTLCNAIAENLPSLIPMIINLILYIVQVITENIPIIFDAGVSILFAVVDGIIQSIPILAEDAPQIINALCDTINAHLFELIAVGLALIVNLAQGLWDNRQVILDNLGQIALMIFNIISTIDLMSAGKSILTALKDGISSMKSVVKSGMDDVWTAIKNVFKDGPEKFREIGANVIEGLKKGFIETVDKVKGEIIDSIAFIADGIKDFLGIASPSKLMRDEVGKFMPQGIAVGFEAEVPNVSDDINSNISDITDSIAVDDIQMKLADAAIRFETEIPDISDDINSSISDITDSIAVDDIQMNLADIAVRFETEIPDISDDINSSINDITDSISVDDIQMKLEGLDINSIYSQFDAVVNSQTSVPAYSDILTSSDSYSNQASSQQTEQSETGIRDIIIPISLFKNSGMLDKIVVSAGARANATSGGISI